MKNRRTHLPLKAIIHRGALALVLAFSFLGTSWAFGPSSELCWIAPTTNVDGSTLTNLGGFRIYWGTATGNYVNNKDVNLTPASGGRCLTGTVGVTLGSLGLTTAGIYFFSVSAYNTNGTESAKSVEATGPFDAATPSTPTGAALR